MSAGKNVVILISYSLVFSEGTSSKFHSKKSLFGSPYSSVEWAISLIVYYYSYSQVTFCRTKLLHTNVKNLKMDKSKRHVIVNYELENVVRVHSVFLVRLFFWSLSLGGQSQALLRWEFRIAWALEYQRRRGEGVHPCVRERRKYGGYYEDTWIERCYAHEFGRSLVCRTSSAHRLVSLWWYEVKLNLY